MKRLWSVLMSVLALLSVRPQIKASTERIKSEPTPTEQRLTVTLTYGDKVDRKAFEHKQKIRAWFIAHGLWANKPDKTPRTWTGGRAS